MKSFYDEFIEDMRNIKNYSSQINALENALGTDIWEGFIGNLFDDLFQRTLMPYLALIRDEDWRDQATEKLYSIIFDDPNTWFENSCKEFATTYLKEYLN